MKVFYTVLVALSLISCADQRLTLPSGHVIQNRTLFATTTTMYNPQTGLFVVAADASQAANLLAQGFRIATQAEVMKSGIGAVGKLGSNAVKAFSDS